MDAKTRTVLGSVDLGVGGSDNGLGVAVGEGFGEALTCKIRVEVGVDGHLGVGGLSEGVERRLGGGQHMSKGQSRYVFLRTSSPRIDKSGKGRERTGDLRKVKIAGSFDSEAVKERAQGG